MQLEDIPGAHSKLAQEKLRQHSFGLLEQESETLSHYSFVEAHREDFDGCPWKDALLPAHALIVDGYAHLSFIVK